MGSTRRSARCLGSTAETAQAETDEVTEINNTRRRRHCSQEAEMVRFGVVVWWLLTCKKKKTLQVKWWYSRNLHHGESWLFEPCIGGEPDH